MPQSYFTTPGTSLFAFVFFILTKNTEFEFQNLQGYATNSSPTVQILGDFFENLTCSVHAMFSDF